MRHSVLGAVVSLAASGFAGAEFPRPRSNNATANPAPLVFSTYFGGGSTDAASAVAVDAAGNSYVTGWTASPDLPVKNAFQPQSGGGVDAFVAKFDPAGALVYCTYLGGSGDDRAFGIAVDATGAVYVTGWTASTDFPTAGNPYQRSLAGGSNAFVAKLGATGGSLIFSTYLGGGASDQGRAIALDASGDAFIAGQTTSWNFPTLNPLQAGRKGLQDAFVAEVGGSGGLLFSTYLGGSGTDTAAAIAVGADGCLYLTGATDSLDFPTLNAIQPVNGGYQDAFVTKLSPGGASLVFSTYLGGSGGSVDYPETGLAIAVDPSNNVYVAGVTSSSNFPTRNALQPALAGWTDAFVTKVDATGTLLDFSTYLGGSSLDYGVAIQVDSSGAACVAGYSTSPDFPLANPVQSGAGGSYDAFLSCLASSGQALIFSSLLGGSNSDAAYGLAMDTGFLYVAGLSASSDLPLKNPFQSLNTNGKIGAFLTKLTRYQTPLPAAPVPTFPGNGAVNISLSPTLTWNAASWAASYAVYFGASPSPPLVVATANLSYSPGALAAGTTYYWQVAGYNSAGSSASGVDSFTTACTYGISPTGATLGAGTASGSVAVVAPAGCPWTASSDSTTWLTITSGSSGSGNGTVGYALTANPTNTSRSGTLTIAGQSFTATQAGAACAYSLGASSAAPGAGAGSGSVTVTAPGGCGWTASSNSTTWLTITSGSTGSGNGTVGYALTANPNNTSRSGTLTIGGQSFTVTQAGAGCAYSLGATSVAPGAGAGSGSVTVTAPGGCGWTASSDSTTWLTITSGNSGSGNGTVSYALTANPNNTSRSGTLTIGGQSFTVTQAGAGCAYSLGATSVAPGAGAGSGSVTVTAPGGCGWTASSDSTTWLTITSGNSGSGNGTVSYALTANPNNTSRSGTLTIGGQSFTVTQAGAGCAYSLGATSVAPGAGAGSGSVTVTAPGGCGWTASSNSTTWLTITSGSTGSGNGTVSYALTANPNNTSRSGTLTIGGQSFTVTQAGAACAYSLGASSAAPGAGAGSGSVTVTAPGGCGWTASSNSTTWLTITSGSTGSGNGTVSYAVTANPNNTSRSGTLTIAGQSFTVTQAGVGCAYSLGASSAAPGAGAGSGSVTVTAPGGCGWTASSNSTTWLIVTSGSSGSGSGSVSYAVTANYLMAANPGSAQRTGTLIVAGQTFTVTQAVATAYLAGDVAPYTTDTAPYFGDGILNILDLIQELFAVDNVPGFRPAACSDRFDAMDLYPADTASTRGGDGVLDIRDLILELFRVDNLDLARPVRASPGGGCQSADSQGAAKTSGARPSHGAPPKLRAEIPSAVLVLGDPEALSETEERVSVTLKADRDLARVAVTFAMGDQLSDLRFVATAETPPSLAQDRLPGVVAAAWLAGLSVRAEERILLGYVEGPAGALANLKMYGLSASGLDDNREVRLEVSGTRRPGVIPANGSGGESEN